MSHASLGEIKAEPNLVPLLDLVFQLIMFFMICVSFVTDQVNERIKLPEAQSARPLDKGEVDVLFLNLDDTGKLIVPGQQHPLSSEGEMRYYLRQQYADAKRTAEEKKKRQVNTVIIIRADKNATYANVFQLLRLCKDIGYHKLQLRAYPKGTA
jgi:biopolymer transport protein ExbD